MILETLSHPQHLLAPQSYRQFIQGGTNTTGNTRDSWMIDFSIH
jgi:hypothetical protein